MAPYANKSGYKSFMNKTETQRTHFADDATLRYIADVEAELTTLLGLRTFKRGDHVHKRSGARWQGKVVGYYSTTLTPEGYAVESDTESGSVQIYPAKALAKVQPTCLTDPAEVARMEKIKGLENTIENLKQKLKTADAVVLDISDEDLKVMLKVLQDHQY